MSNTNGELVAFGIREHTRHATLMTDQIRRALSIQIALTLFQGQANVPTVMSVAKWIFDGKER